MPDEVPAEKPESAEERRRRLDRIFGDVLPDTTADERDPGSSPASEDAGEAWLKAQVPPHHG